VTGLTSASCPHSESLLRPASNYYVGLGEKSPPHPTRVGQRQSAEGSPSSDNTTPSTETHTPAPPCRELIGGHKPYSRKPTKN